MKRFLFLAAIPFLLGGIYAQSLEIHDFKDNTKSYKNGDTIRILLPSLDQQQENTLVTVKNISSTDINTSLKQRVLNRIPNALYSFCFGNCYEDNLEPVMIGESTVTIPAGSFSDDLCVMDYNPNGQAGTTYVRYTFFNNDNPADSACVIIKYDDSEVSIAKNEPKTLKMGVFPNPCNNAASIRIQGGESLQQPVLRICNLLGNVLSEEALPSGNTTVKVDVSQWTNGIYFYSVWDGDRNLGTQKMIVAH
jgi:hypothetical protein